MGDPGLSCRELTELVTAYLDRSMPRELRQEFLRHLKACPPCFRYLRQLRATARALQRAPVVEPAPEVRAALLEQFKAWQGPASRA